MTDSKNRDLPDAALDASLTAAQAASKTESSQGQGGGRPRQWAVWTLLLVLLLSTVGLSVHAYLLQQQLVIDQGEILKSRAMGREGLQALQSDVDGLREQFSQVKQSLLLLQQRQDEAANQMRELGNDPEQQFYQQFEQNLRQSYALSKIFNSSAELTQVLQDGWERVGERKFKGALKLKSAIERDQKLLALAQAQGLSDEDFLQSLNLIDEATEVPVSVTHQPASSQQPEETAPSAPPAYANEWWGPTYQWLLDSSKTAWTWLKKQDILRVEPSVNTMHKNDEALLRSSMNVTDLLAVRLLLRTHIQLARQANLLHDGAGMRDQLNQAKALAEKMLPEQMARGGLVSQLQVLADSPLTTRVPSPDNTLAALRELRVKR